MIEYAISGDKRTCFGCGACADICGHKALTLVPDEEGFLYPELDEGACIQCGLCEEVCPYGKERLLHSGRQRAFAMQLLDPVLLSSSSSGGAFMAFAQTVLDMGGCVSGCTFNDSFEAAHMMTSCKKELETMQGSKYVQSDTRGNYLEVKRKLESGTPVLFSGTPCQVAGLRSFLIKDFEKLYTVDLICHGVPSPMLLDSYLGDARESKGEITSFRFRDKRRNGWCSQGSMHWLEGARERVASTTPFNDSYYYYYLANAVSREPCYSCPFSRPERVGDVTIGDYWNYGEIESQIASEKGVSAIIANTKKGEWLVDAIGGTSLIERSSVEHVVAGNGNLSAPCERPCLRDAIYQEIREKGYAAIAKKYCHYQRIRPFVKKHIPKKLKKALRRIVGYGQK